MNIPDLNLLSSSSISDLSIGPTFTDLNCDVSSLHQLFGRLRVFRLRLPANAHEVGSLNQFLDLLDTDIMVHLEVAVLGSIVIPWSQKLSNFRSLEILRISKYTTCEAAEIQDIDKYLASESSLRILHIHYKVEAISDIRQIVSDRLALLPKLKHLYIGGITSFRIFGPGSETDPAFPRVVTSEIAWAELDLFVAPMSLAVDHMFSLLTLSLSNVDLWIRQLMYSITDLDALTTLLSGWADLRIFTPSQEHLIAHPLFVPIFAEVIRRHSTNPDLWAIIAPLCYHLFDSVKNVLPLSSKKWPTPATSDGLNSHYYGVRPSMSDHPDAEERHEGASFPPWNAPSFMASDAPSPYALGRSEAEIASTALLQLIFENLRPAIERAISALGVSEEELSVPHSMPILPSQPISGEFWRNAGFTGISTASFPTNHEETEARRRKRANCDILRFLAIICRHAPSTVYPRNLCFSNSDTILRFIMMPWQAGFASLSEYVGTFIDRTFTGFSRLTENLPLCHRLYHFGLANRVEDMLSRWVPFLPNGDSPAPEIPVFIPLLAQVTPEITMDLLKNHPRLVERLIHFLPNDHLAEWTHPIWSHLTSHGALTCYDYPSKPTPYCRMLIKNVLMSARIHNGGIGHLLAVYLSSFCEHCRQLYVEGIGDELESPFNDITTGLDLMVYRSRHFSDFSVTVFSWLVEPASRVKEWLQAFQDKLEADGFFDRSGMVLRTKVEYFFEDLASTVLLHSERAADTCEPWTEVMSMDVRAKWETLSTVSQSPAFIAILFSRLVSYILKLFFELGQPYSALSVFYHTSCFKGLELMAELEKTEVASERTEIGGMKILPDMTLPYRLLSKSTPDADSSPAAQNRFTGARVATSSTPTHREDGLTVTTEVLLSLLAAKGMKDNVYILGRLLANTCYYHAGLRARMQQSPRVSQLIGHVLTTVDSIGEQTSLLVFAFEVYGSFSSQWIRHNVSTPVWKAMEDVLRIIPILTASNQPWWQAVQVFLLRSLLRRSMPLILNITAPTKSSSSEPLSPSEEISSSLSLLTIEQVDSSLMGEITLDEKQKETVVMLIDVCFMLSLSQDITTTETAFEALFDALYVPEEKDSNRFYLSPLHTAVSREVSRITVQRIKERYEDRLKMTAEIERFGCSSHAENVYELYKLLSRTTM